MAAKAKKQEKAPAPKRRFRPLRFVKRLLLLAVVLIVGLVALYSKVNPPTTITILADYWQRGEVRHEWVAMEDIAPVMARSAVAAEDANFCLHWGFDVRAIKMAFADGAVRGASTISQQVTKNVFLWQGRSWVRKALEAGLTPLVELMWSKRRIVEVYLNVAEMGPGIYGVGAASQALFGTAADKLTARQAARLAVVLPNPKERDAANLSPSLSRRATRIEDGAATIEADGRATCFED